MNLDDIAARMTRDLTPADLAATPDDLDLAEALIDDAPEDDTYDDALIEAIELADPDALTDALTARIATLR